MKLVPTSVSLAAILAASLTGIAAAQSDAPNADSATDSTITIVISFDGPVLAGYSASVEQPDGATVEIEDDSVLRIELSAGADLAATDIEVALSTDAGSTVAKVSANDASFEELVAALESVDVAPADRWAREIMEYRPYATDDPTLAHLQDELAKYDPSPDTLAGILSVLEP